MSTQLARRAMLFVTYKGIDISAPLAESLLDLTYSDNPSGSLDDLQITVEDRAGKWRGDWSPVEGDRITASIRTVNWSGPATFATLPCGSFNVDTVECSGPPDIVRIKATALPGGVSVKRERRTKTWEKIKLKTLAGDFAKRAGLKLMYEFADNPSYDSLSQTDQTDLAFLLDLCSKEGAALKVSGGKLIIFDEAAYEKKSPVATIQRDDVLSYSFSWSTAVAAYRACQLTYTGAKNKTIKATYVPPGAPKTGPVLKINETVSSHAEAERVARNRLREQNKEYGRGQLSLPGDPRMAAGVTIRIKGWGRFDSKYIVDSAVHTVDGSGGYRTDLEIRKVLGW
jgi:phage protein D